MNHLVYQKNVLYLHSEHSNENRAGFPKPYCTSTKLHCATSKQTIFIYFTHLESCKAVKLSCLSLVVKTGNEVYHRQFKWASDQKFRLLGGKKKH